MPNGKQVNRTRQPFNEAVGGFIERTNRYAQRVLTLPNDSFEKTVAVAFALCLVGAILVSGSAVVLKPLQESNKSIDMKKNILNVVGLWKEGQRIDIDQAFKQIEPKIVDLATGDYVESIDPASYDQRQAAKDPSQNVKIPPKEDIASIKTRAKYAKVYLWKPNDELKAIILPVHGYGLWSTMYGFLALESDGQTVIGLNFYDQAETPGLGGEVVNPQWRALWKGKKVFDERGEPALHLIKGTVDPAKPGSEYEVDGLAGATLTSRGVTNLIRYWMSEEGFGPYLSKIRSERGQL